MAGPIKPRCSHVLTKLPAPLLTGAAYPTLRSKANSRGQLFAFIFKMRIQKLRSNAGISAPGRYGEVRGDDRKDLS